MQIFQNEINDGIADQISASASIAYASVAEPYTGSNTNTLKGIKTIASIDDSDLYYVQSILVSSSWNKKTNIKELAENGFNFNPLST